jgi:hypothetical protein
MGDDGSDPIAAAYQRANQLNARLASRYEVGLAAEGKRVADQLLSYMREQLGAEYDAFVARCERSEEFSLHESARVEKEEARMKGLYLRATGLLETIADAEARQRPR